MFNRKIVLGWHVRSVMVAAITLGALHVHAEGA